MPLSDRKALASCSSLVLMNLRSPVLSTSSTYTCSFCTFSFTSSSFFFSQTSLACLSTYLVMACFENSMLFSRSIFSCSSGEEATGASLPPFLAAFLSSFYGQMMRTFFYPPWASSSSLSLASTASSFFSLASILEVWPQDSLAKSASFATQVSINYLQQSSQIQSKTAAARQSIVNSFLLRQPKFIIMNI